LVKVVFSAARGKDLSTLPREGDRRNFIPVRRLVEDGNSSAKAGDLARAVLQLHAQDLDNRATLAQLLNGFPPERFLNGTSIALGTAVLILLQTLVRFERDNDGNGSVVIEKEAASSDLLRTVVQKYLGVEDG
jgi:hypothetical protein